MLVLLCALVPSGVKGVPHPRSRRTKLWIFFGASPRSGNSSDKRAGSPRHPTGLEGTAEQPERDTPGLGRESPPGGLTVTLLHDRFLVRCSSVEQSAPSPCPLQFHLLRGPLVLLAQPHPGPQVTGAAVSCRPPPRLGAALLCRPEGRDSAGSAPGPRSAGARIGCRPKRAPAHRARASSAHVQSVSSG